MRRTLGVVGGVVLGIALSQFPEYAQQYTQRLGGAVDELRAIVEDFDRDAVAAGLSRRDALLRYEATKDEFIARRGISMDRTFARYAQLSEALALVQNASGWERATLLPKFLDTDVGARTLQNFEPAVPVTPEGFVYTGAGFLIGYLVTSALWRLLVMPFRRGVYWRGRRSRSGT